MNVSRAVAVDFETEAIEPRPDFPPKPVGLAVQWPGDPAKYLHWGHHAGLPNSTKAEAKAELRKIVKSGRPIVMHNALFDCAVAKRLGVEIPWLVVLDTQIYHFIVDPFERVGALKPIAAKWLGMEPDEQDDLRNWIFSNVPHAKRAKKQWGKYIAHAPGNIVSPYAKGDVIRTKKLLVRLDREISDERMRDAIVREHRLLPVINEMETRGVPIDRSSLKREHEGHWLRAAATADDWIRDRLGADIEVSKSRELADAIEEAGIVDEWILTAKGDRSTSYQNLRVLRDEGNLHDEYLPEVYAYRALMSHACGTFARPWLDMSEGTDKIYCNWNAVRQDRSIEGGRGFGARTGRFSSSPNFQNITKLPQRLAFSKAAHKQNLTNELRSIHLPKELKRLPPLPNLRWFVKAPKNATLVGADFSQQELRILAHYLDDPTLTARYASDPDLNFHRLAQSMIHEMSGLDVSYTQIKPVDFGIVYGAGGARIAEQIEVTYDMALEIRAAWKKAMPVGPLERDFRVKEANGEPYFTIGGRRYTVEKGFAYKALNYAIQGSAADEMKEAMIRYVDAMKAAGLTWDQAGLILTVHDEPVTLVQDADPKLVRGLLVEAMESTGADGSSPMLNIPMRADSYVRQRWGKKA